MNIQNITGVFLGDSVTEGWGAERYEDTYFNQIAKRTGMRAFGYGVGGTRITRTKGDEPRRDFLYRCEHMEKNAQLVVIFGGTNDFGFCAPIVGEDEFAFSGACRLLFSRLAELYPEAKIVVMLPLQRVDCIVSRENTLQREQLPLVKYVETLKKCAENFSFRVVFKISTSLYKSTTRKEKFSAHFLKTNDAGEFIYCPDGLHPNAAGHALIAEKLLGVLEKL